MIKTILAWCTAQIQSQTRLHVGSATLDPVPRLAARLGSNSARRGSARGWWCGRWVPLCWRVCWLVDDVADDMACLLYMLTSPLHQADVIMVMLLYMMMSQLHHANVIPGMSTVHDDVTFASCWRHLIRASHVGRVNWYSGRVNSSGWRRRVGRVCARGQTPCRRVMESAAMADVRFWRCFHQWLRLGLLYTVVWSKHNFWLMSWKMSWKNNLLMFYFFQVY